jgi:hypothetical protein
LPERAFFISAHEPAISGYVGRENSREMTFRLRRFQNALRRFRRWAANSKSLIHQTQFWLRTQSFANRSPPCYGPDDVVVQGLHDALRGVLDTPGKNGFIAAAVNKSIGGG